MTKHETIMIGDFGKDLDDENALLYALGAQAAGELSLQAVIANLAPAERRARIALGTLETLGYDDIPVGVGTSCNTAEDLQPYEFSIGHASRTPRMPNGQSVLIDTLQGAIEQSVTLVLNSGLTDAAELFKNYPRLVLQKVARVAIMGGVVTSNNLIKLGEQGYIQPDTAANNAFDPTAAEYVYEWLQANQLPTTITTREVAYACKFDMAFYERIAATHPIGADILARQKPFVAHLWRAAQAAPGSAMRGTLPDRCDRPWFIETYLQSIDPGAVEDIWETYLRVGTFQLYDPINVASVTRPDLFDPYPITVNGTEHQIIGLSALQPGITGADLLRKHVEQRILQGLDNKLKVC